MENNNVKIKSSKNTRWLVGINALQKIRSLVDDYENHDQKNKRRAIILSASFIVLFSVCLYLIVFYDSEKTTLLISPERQFYQIGETKTPPD